MELKLFAISVLKIPYVLFLKLPSDRLHADTRWAILVHRSSFCRRRSQYLERTQISPSLSHWTVCLSFSSLARRVELTLTTRRLTFGNGDGGGGPLAPMLENLRRCRAVANENGEIPKVKMGNSVDEFYDNLVKTTDNGKKLPTWCADFRSLFPSGLRLIEHLTAGLESSTSNFTEVPQPLTVRSKGTIVKPKSYCTISNSSELSHLCSR